MKYGIVLWVYSTAILSVFQLRKKTMRIMTGLIPEVHVDQFSNTLQATFTHNCKTSSIE